VPNSAAPALRVCGLTAGYGGTAIVSNIDLAVLPGDWLGLLGANGSGKSTLLRAVTGQIPVLQGEISIGGIDLHETPERSKSLFGYAVDGADLPGALTMLQYLEMVASIRRCAANAWPIENLPRHFGFEPWLNEPIAACSFGTRAKLSIAAALLGTPPLLILDESLNGLDPVSSWRIKQVLRSMIATGGHAVMLSTHMLETVSAACTSAIFLHGGKIAQQWNTAALQAACAAPGGFEAAIMRVMLPEEAVLF
jgi:ABC-2 type transport system ATP-binding protein